MKATPPEVADLLVIGVAQEGGEHSEITTKMSVIPLPILGRQLGEWPWILHPELLVDGVLLEVKPIEVQVEHVVEHARALKRGDSLQEVAVRMCSKDLRIAHLLAAQGLVVESRLGCSGIFLIKIN